MLVPDFSAGAGPSLRPACRVWQNGRALTHYLHRPRKLTPAQVSAIRALTGTKSLRELAAEFGVSHETVRAVLRAPAVVAARP